MATTVSRKTKQPEEEVAQEVEEAQEDEATKELDEQIEVFEPVAKVVDRTLVHPVTNEEKTFVQKEMGFMAKLKFFRLLSGTLRLASDTQGANPAEFLQEAFGEVVGPDGEIAASVDTTGSWLTAVMRLVELAPDFLEDSYILILGVKPEDQAWALEALESLDDDEGVDILETFIAQNGKAIRRFFDKHLRRVGQTISREIGQNEGTEQE
jgi:hypothetical protein